MTGNEAPAVIRASNSDRERVASILRAAATEGLLTLDEADERLAGAYGATYRHELDPLTEDLPDGGRRLYAGSPEGTAQRERFRSAARRGLIQHAAVVALVAAVAITVWALSAAPHFFPAPIIFFALFTLVRHARRVAWAHDGWNGSRFDRSWDGRFEGGWGGRFGGGRDSGRPGWGWHGGRYDRGGYDRGGYGPS